MSLLSLHSAVTEETRCPDWKAIFATYQRAVEVYSRAVADAADVSPGGFAAAWHNAEKARQNCDNLRTELLDHEHYHGCFVAASVDCVPEPASRSSRRF
jgi:hypothetical protein